LLRQGTAGSRRPESRAWQSAQSPPRRHQASPKKHLPGAEQPLGTTVDVKRRAKPPSPSPSITRRRTPAALAVGVHPFEGRRFPAPWSACTHSVRSAGTLLRLSNNVRALFFLGRTWGVPASGTEGDAGEAYRTAFTARFRHPDDYRPRKRYVWGTRQSRWLRTADGFAV